MPIEQTTAPPASPLLRAWQVYSMAAIYLVIGLAIGFVLRTSEPAAPTAPVAAPRTAAPNPASGANPADPHAAVPNSGVPSLDQMRQIADRQAAPLVEKLKSNPNDSALLMQLGSIYHSAHQFGEAAAYYGKAVAADPKNTAARTKLAISLYRAGDADAAVTQLNRALQDSPADANALFNLGMIRWQAQQDAAGAVAAWRQLLKSNPQLSDDRKAEVQKLIDGVTASTGDRKPRGGEKP